MGVSLLREVLRVRQGKQEGNVRCGDEGVKEALEGGFAAESFGQSEGAWGKVLN